MDAIPGDQETLQVLSRVVDYIDKEVIIVGEGELMRASLDSLYKLVCAYPTVRLHIILHSPVRREKALWVGEIWRNAI